MKRLRELEQLLIRLETLFIVVLVLLMLGLASYNVLYRNVLVPLQKYWAHSGPPVARTVIEDAPAAASAAADPLSVVEAEVDQAGGADDFGGGFGADEPADDDGAADDFGGGFGKTDDAPEEGAEAEGAADDFGGGFGPPDTKEPPEPEARPEDEGGAGDFGGGFGNAAEEPENEGGADDFGGGFGEARDADEDAAGEGAEGFGGGFGNAEDSEAEAETDGAEGDPFADLPDIRVTAEEEVLDEPEGGPPPPGSFAARGVAFIDAIKLDWIDIFLRQLVIMVSFLGAALATRRGKHINIDALSKLLSPSMRRWAGVATNGLAVGVCIVLSITGKRFVAIGLEHPVDVLPWAKEWAFQLMFPIGFGILAIHFGLRFLEQLLGWPEGEEQETGGGR